MNLTSKIVRLSLAAVLLGGLSSCNDDSSENYEVTDYTDALITSFSVSDNDSVCNSLSSYSFTIDQLGVSDPALANNWVGSGIIFNADSLPYGSKPDSIVVSMDYDYPTAVSFYHYDSLWNLVDSVDFSSQDTIRFSPYAYTRLEVTAYDGTTKKSYFVKVNVHQVEGDTIRWQYVAKDLFDNSNITAQKVDTIGSTLYWYIERDSATQTVQTATLGKDLTLWSSPVTITAPELLQLHTMYCWDNLLFAISTNGAMLTSSDGYNWNALETTNASNSNAMAFVNILGRTLAAKNSKDSLRTIINDGSALRFASSSDGNSWTVGSTIPANFPIRDYTAPLSVAAKTTLGNTTSRMYIVGGRMANGDMTSSTWTCDGNVWAEFEQLFMPPTAGASIVSYTLDTDHPNTFWILYPGEVIYPGATEPCLTDSIFFSENSGVTWRTLDSEYDKYSDNAMIAPAAYHTAFCDPKTYWMYFIGGQNEDGASADIIAGQLLKLTFDKRR